MFQFLVFCYAIKALIDYTNMQLAENVPGLCLLELNRQYLICANYQVLSTRTSLKLVMIHHHDENANVTV